jgi:iron complex outermembrane receptor protein
MANRLSRDALARAVATITVLGAPAAPAAPAPASAPARAAFADLQEITVTARKREERLIEVPVSIAAYTDEQIERQAIRNLQDIALRTPGLQFNNMAGYRAGRQDSSIRFRGMHVGSWLASAQIGSLFVDGVFALSGGQSIGLADLERVEVIKGPQSAFFGRNTFAGAVNYITKNPSLTEYTGRFEVSGGEFDHRDVSASVGGPLIDGRVGFLVSGQYYSRGALFRASDGGGLGEEESQAVSGVLYAEPTEGISLKLRAFYQEDDDGPDAGVYLPGRLADTCTGLTISGLDNAGNPATLRPRGYVCGRVPDPFSTPATVIDKNTTLYPRILTTSSATRQPAPNYVVDRLASATFLPGVPKLDAMGLKREITRLSLIGRFDLPAGMSLEASAAYNSNDVNWIEDYDRTAAEGWYSADPQKMRDWTGDVRLTSRQDARFRWLAGVNYYDQTFTTNGGGGATVNTCFNFLPGAPGGLCAFGPNLSPPVFTGGDLATVKSVYAALSFDILPTLTLDLEGRYQEDARTRSGFEQMYDDWLPRAILSWHPVDGATLYGSYSRGTAVGAVIPNVVTCSNAPTTAPYTDPNTGRPSTASECSQLQALLGGDFRTYTPSQTLDALEIGWKQALPELGLQFEAAAYRYEWKNQLSSRIVSYVRRQASGLPAVTPTAAAIAVPGSSEIYGVELSSAWRPTERLELGLSAGYNHNEYVDVLALSVAGIYGSGNVRGKQAPRYPRWQGSLSAAYTGPLTAEWSWFVGGDSSYVGRSYTDESNLAYIGAYTVTNARIGVERDALRIELWARNLLDENAWVAGTRLTDFSIPGDFSFRGQGISLAPLEPRSLGARLSYRF